MIFFKHFSSHFSFHFSPSWEGEEEQCLIWNDCPQTSLSRQPTGKQDWKWDGPRHKTKQRTRFL